jgi:hypothetical protein
MRLSERHSLPVPLADAWGALNDLDVLLQALPGCEMLLELARDEFVGEMAVPFGPLTSRFTIYVQRRDIDAPHRCTLHFETRSSGAGGKGSAAMRLAPQGADATTLHVEVDVRPSGLVARFGGPLIDLAAQQMADLFFERFRRGAIARHSGVPLP